MMFPTFTTTGRTRDRLRRRRPNGEKGIVRVFAAYIGSNISGKAPVTGAFPHIQIVFRHSIHEKDARRITIRLERLFRGFCIRLRRSGNQGAAFFAKEASAHKPAHG